MGSASHPWIEPFDYEGILRFLSVRAIPGVEDVRDGTYRRSIVDPTGRPRTITIRNDPESRRLISTTTAPRTAALTSQIEMLFDLRHDPEPLTRDLRTTSSIDVLIARNPGVRVPGAWDRFELCVRAIVGQQISVRGARTMLGRIAERFGDSLPRPSASLSRTFPRPDQLANADLESSGLTRARSETIRDVAGLFQRGVSSTGDLLASLAGIRGIGPWTLGYVSMRAKHDTNAYPVGDLILRRFAEEPGTLSARELELRSREWQPWRSYASILLWDQAARQPDGGSR